MQNKKILVVEDDRDLQSLVQMVLETEGYSVLTADNGEEALRAMESNHPGLILLDMKMPIMNGWEFSKELRRRQAPHVPVVVFTAAEDARKRATEINADGWLGKPFEMAELLATARRFLGPAA